MTFDTLIEKAPLIIVDKLNDLKTLRERPDYHPEESTYEHIKIVVNRLIKTGNPDLIMAGLFHDIKKKDCAEINPRNGHSTSPNHDIEAAFMIRMNIANKSKNFLGFIESIRANPERVAQLCEQHMRIKVYSEMNEKKKAKFRRMDIFSDVLTFSCADNMLADFVYPYNDFFPTIKHKALYLHLNSLRQIEWEKGLTYIDKDGNKKPTLQALNPRSYEDAMQVSINQLEYDMKAGHLRYSLEQMFAFNMDEFAAINLQNHQTWVEKFKSLG